MPFHHNDLIDAMDRLDKGGAKAILLKHLDEISRTDPAHKLNSFNNLVKYMNYFHETIHGFKNKFDFKSDVVSRMIDYTLAGPHMNRLIKEEIYPKLIKDAHQIAVIVSETEKETK